MRTAKLVQSVLREFSLPKLGVHGVAHWARVLENGRQLAKHTSAKMHVVEFFALLHDSKRSNDSLDEDHGIRAAEYTRSLRGTFIDLSDADFNLLYEACAYHSRGLVDADITVQTCWDADRLDLGRTGILPCPKLLCSTEAKETGVIAVANERSRNRFIPRLVVREWSLPPLLAQTHAGEEIPEILYHGSRKEHINFLLPKKKSYPGNEPTAPRAVYAAKNPAYAVAHVFKRQKRLGYYLGDPRCHLELLESDKGELNKKTSLYLVGRSSFQRVPDQSENYRSMVPVEVLGEIAYPDIKTAVEELGGIVKIYPKWPRGGTPAYH